MSKMTADEYLAQCRMSCCDRLADPELFGTNNLQTNALRVESIRDTGPRCGQKPPSHWADGAKARGWGAWCYSGGSAAVYGHCDADCPMKDFFLRHAPYKHLRALADANTPKE